jgi:hypothetical protein
VSGCRWGIVREDDSRRVPEDRCLETSRGCTSRAVERAATDLVTGDHLVLGREEQQREDFDRLALQKRPQNCGGARRIGDGVTESDRLSTGIVADDV